MNIHSLLVCSVFLLLATRVQAQPELVSAGQRVLIACADAYKSLREFKGRAAVISQSRIEVKPGTAQTSNDTSDAAFDFVRDVRFNISGHNPQHRKFEINSTPQKTTTSYQFSEKQENRDMENIELAVASFTGVARCAPTTIPALLLDSNWGFPFFSREEATLEGTETFGGHRCFVVKQEREERPETARFWIDAQSFLLRGMRKERGDYSHPMDFPKGVKAPADLPPNPQMHIFFSNQTYVFSIEKTLPSEEELAATAKQNTNLPRVEDETKRN